MKRFAFLLLALFLGGCADAPESPGAEPANPPDAAAAKLVAEPGKPLVWKSKTLEGNIALDILYHPAPGECDTTAMFAIRDHPDGPQAYSRGVTVDGEATGSWSAAAGVGAWGVVAGESTKDVIPATEGAVGFGGTYSVADGDRSQFWANAVHFHEETTVSGAAVYLQVACTVPTELTIRAAREAFVATPGDFTALAGAGASAAGDAAVFGAMFRDFSTSAEWWYYSSDVQSMDLRVTTPEWEQQWTDPSEGVSQDPLPAGGSWLYLDSVGVGDNFLVGAAAWQPVASMAAVEALPNWV